MSQPFPDEGEQDHDDLTALPVVADDVDDDGEEDESDLDAAVLVETAAATETAAAMRTVSQALSAARTQVRNPSRDWYNLCLGFVRTCWGFEPSGIKDADAGWSMSKKRHGSGTPPAGAPVYWAVGHYGHVALSAGGGKVYSTDIRRRGKVDLVPMREITNGWNARYRGWTADYCGRVDLPVKVPPPPKYEPFPGAGFFTIGRDSPIITAMGKRLVAVGCGDHYQVGPGPVLSRADLRNYQDWQEKLGLSGRDADGIPGRWSWGKLKVPNV